MIRRAAKNIALGALVHGSGGHVAGWRHPDAYAAGQLDIDFNIELAQLLERGRFDALFLTDVVGVWGADLDALSYTGRAEHFEPLTLLSALATATTHLGLVATATTTYNEPYHLARKFASLDHLSHGRAGWNIVTSVVPHEAGNFGRKEHLEHELRYRRADEFVGVVRGLWDGFSDAAKVQGSLNISRSPQGHPVLFQAGASETGRNFAAHHGEILFTAQPDLPGAQQFSADMRERVAAAGRDPADIRVWPVLAPLIADTEHEARKRATELDELVHDAVARRFVQDNLGGEIDLSDYPLDAPVPELPDTNRSKSRQAMMLKVAREQNLTIRQLALHFAGSAELITGTPEQLADRMETWFTEGGADGFNVSFPYFPGPAQDFVDHVVPILRNRGLVAPEYEGTTLRENLGLPNPKGAARQRKSEAST
jgi:alkanesulfonate monooxygenase SsuD/methylene tetrahydromethanopterin reductase-like flavin-dependent oxidoreductase (luciferase family)